MSDRWEKRKFEKETKKLIVKAKKDMLSWMTSLPNLPSEEEIKSWQAGYLAGINAYNNKKGSA